MKRPLTHTKNERTPAAVATARHRVGGYPEAATFKVRLKNHLQFFFATLCVLCASAFLGSGCCYVSGERTADGGLRITSCRFLWTSEAIEFSTTNTNNVAVTLSVGKSSTDDKAVAAVADAAIKAAIKSVAPIP